MLVENMLVIILVILFMDIFAIFSCLCIPSPQSKRIFSPLYVKSVPAWFLSFVGAIQLVPKNTISILIRGDNDYKNPLIKFINYYSLPIFYV